MRKTLSSNGLKERATTSRSLLNARLREHYRYAKHKGFSPTEARLLSFRSLEEIDKIAKERGL